MSVLAWSSTYWLCPSYIHSVDYEHGKVHVNRVPDHCIAITLAVAVRDFTSFWILSSCTCDQACVICKHADFSLAVCSCHSHFSSAYSLMSISSCMSNFIPQFVRLQVWIAPYHYIHCTLAHTLYMLLCVS